MRNLIALTIIAVFSVNAFCAEPINRSDVTGIMKLLNAPYMVDRIEGIRAAGKFTDKQILSDFKIVEKLLDSAKDESLTPPERSEALQALVSLADHQMVDSTFLVENLAKLIANEKADIAVRIDTLYVLGNLGKVKGKTLDQRDFIKKVQRLIKEIAEDKTNKTALRSSAFRVLGAMGAKGTDDVFLGAINIEKKTVIREAAMQGLRNYIEATGDDSQKLMNSICNTTAKLDGDKERDLRINGILVIEQFLANGSDLIFKNKITDFLLERMEKGDDEEMIAASQCLLRIKDDKIIEAYIKQLKKKRGMKATLSLVKGAIELFRPLSTIVSNKNSSSSSKSEATDNATQIIDTILIPLAKLEAAPEALRLTAIMGLGAIPREFSRTNATETLISILQESANQEKPGKIADETTRSLMLISRLEKPFTFEDGSVDIESWSAWFDKNKKFLDAGNAPWDKE